MEFLMRQSHKTPYGTFPMASPWNFFWAGSWSNSVAHETDGYGAMGPWGHGACGTLKKKLMQLIKMIIQLLKNLRQVKKP